MEKCTKCVIGKCVYMNENGECDEPEVNSGNSDAYCFVEPELTICPNCRTMSLETMEEEDHCFCHHCNYEE